MIRMLFLRRIGKAALKKRERTLQRRIESAGLATNSRIFAAVAENSLSLAIGEFKALVEKRQEDYRPESGSGHHRSPENPASLSRYFQSFRHVNSCSTAGASPESTGKTV